MKRFLSVLLVLCVVTTMMIVVAQPVFAAAGGKTITFMTWEPASFKDAIAKYEKDTGNKVEIVADDPNKVRAMGAAGDAIDVVEFHPNQLMDYVRRGYVQSINPVLAKSKLLKVSDLTTMDNLCRFDGNVVGKGDYYGIIKDYGSDVLWYNKKCFDAAKVPYPSQTTPMTADQFQTLCKKLTIIKNGKVVQYGLGEPTWAAPSWAFPDLSGIARAAVSNGQPFNNFEFSADFKKLNFNENTPGVVTYVQRLVDMARKDHSWPSLVDPSSAPAYTLFNQNQAAIQISGSWFVGWNELTKAGSKANIGWAPAPIFYGPKQVYPMDTNCGYLIMKNAQPEAGGLFEYLAVYGGAANAKIAWNIPTVKPELALLPRTDPYWTDCLKYVDKVTQSYKLVTPSPYCPDWTVLNTSLGGTHMKDLFNGKMTVKQWLKEGVAACNAKLAQMVADAE